MYTVACHLVQTVTGESLGGFLKQKIWEPLGMGHTYFDVPDVEEAGCKDELVRPYRWDEEMGEFVEGPWFVQPEGYGAGSVYSWQRTMRSGFGVC